MSFAQKAFAEGYVGVVEIDRGSMNEGFCDWIATILLLLPGSHCMVLDMLHLDSSYVVIRDGMRGTGRNYTPLSLHDVDAFEVAGRIFECQLEPSRDGFISHNLLITSYINMLLRPRYHRLLLTTADTVYASCADSFSIGSTLIDPRSASD
jgi:hypothetical protein